jgi:hypothetical protein
LTGDAGRRLHETKRESGHDAPPAPADVAELEAIFAPDAIVGKRCSDIEAARAGL